MGCKKLNTDFCNVLEIVYSEKRGYAEKKCVNYYPFGLKHKGYNNVVNGQENNHFTYNGKELDESLSLNVIEMDWRQYDPAIGRFNVIDALAEEAYDYTPYRFGFNNPVYWSDPSGLYEVDDDGNISITNEFEVEALLNYLNNNDELSVDDIANHVFTSGDFRYDLDAVDILVGNSESEASAPNKIVSQLNSASKKLSNFDGNIVFINSFEKNQSARAKLDKDLDEMNPVLYFAMFITGGVDIAKNGATYQDMSKTDPERATGLMMTKGQASLTINTLTPTPSSPSNARTSGSIGTTRTRSSYRGSSSGSSRRLTGVKSFIKVSGKVRKVHTGPRGGKYYINTVGNKTYLNRDGTKRIR